MFQVPEKHWHIHPPQQRLDQGEDLQHAEEAGREIDKHGQLVIETLDLCCDDCVEIMSISTMSIIPG